jgi:sn-glycerol 3-phosphate transport system substrate-binding protein
VRIERSIAVHEPLRSRRLLAPSSTGRRELLRAGLAGLAAASLGGSSGCGRSRRRDGRVEATLWFSYGGKNREVLLDLVARFNASQGRYWVTPTYQGDYFEALAKLRTALAAGAAPTFTHVVGEVVPYLASAGVLEPLSAYEGARDIRFVRALAQEGSYLGGERQPLWAVPFNRSTPIMYLNGKIMAERGLAVPRTWAGLREAAIALTERTSSGVRWGYQVPISWWFWVAMVGQAGGEVVGPAGEPTLGGAAGERALSFWQQLVHQDRVMRPPPGRDYNAWQVTNQDYLQERVAITWTSTAFLRYLEENARFPVVAAPLPSDARASVPTGGTLFVVLRGAPEPEKLAAWAFLRWMCQADQTIAWATRTGYLPVTVDAVERLEAEGFYAKHPNDRVAYDQLADAQPWPWSPTLFRIQREVVEPRLEEAVITGRDAHAVLDEARAEAREA